MRNENVFGFRLPATYFFVVFCDPVFNEREPDGVFIRGRLQRRRVIRLRRGPDLALWKPRLWRHTIGGGGSLAIGQLYDMGGAEIE